MDNTWSKKRKALYIGSSIFIFVSAISFFSLFNSDDVKTCFDGIKNQGETATDCGGPCSAICTSLSKEPLVLWSKMFEITTGWYSALALIENPNVNAHSLETPYIFTLKNLAGDIIAESHGSTFIPNVPTFALFASGFQTSDIPVTAEFEFTGPISWERDEQPAPDIAVRSKVFSKLLESPRLDIRLENKDIHDIVKLEVVVVVYDSLKNPIAASRTFLEDVKNNDITDVVFTWPLPFPSEPASAEIFTRVIPH